MDKNKMILGTQGTNIATDRWKTAEFRHKIVRKVMDELIENGMPYQKFSLSELANSVERFEMKVYNSAKTEEEYLALVKSKVKSIRALSRKYESKQLHTNASGSGKDANIDWQELTYEKFQKLKDKYYRQLAPLYQKITIKLQEFESSTQYISSKELAKFKNNKTAMEYLFSLFDMNKSQITTEIKDRAGEAEHYIEMLLKTVSPNNQGNQTSDLQFKQPLGPSNSKNSQTNNMHLQEPRVAVQIGNSQPHSNQPSFAKEPGNAVQEQTKLAQQETGAFNVSINPSRISSSPMSKDNNNQFSQKSSVVSEEEPSPEMQRLIKALTNISPEALRASVSDIEEVVRLSDALPAAAFIGALPDMVDELGLPILHIPEGWKMPRSFVATAFDSTFLNVTNFGNQSTNTEESDFNSFTFQAKRPRNAENKHLLAEIKEINNRFIDCEVIIDEKDNIEQPFGIATEQTEGLVIKIIFNAVSISQNLVYEFTTDKKSLITPLRLLVPPSYPSSSLVILDELPFEISDDLRALTERTKAKLRFNLQSMNQPWVLKDITRLWERCAREAINEYALTIGGGTFTSVHGGWEVCRF
uniref:Mediator of RNA polymerase II transcription subunit 15a-like isoform X2 n=1 Tax=Cicer arietinum TaxID=3827 RepID=A0A3Q7XVL1_CICAR|nr:mediator of RNA polymerase II transcription subunit 15a-like isoform X2 [Cicer arietinum]